LGLWISQSTPNLAAVKIELLNTGSELLLGTTQNTHAAWIGGELLHLGLRIARQTTVPDGAPIHEALGESIVRADAIIVTGGLGPTSDDVTRETTADLLGIDLITDEAALRSLEAFFAHRGRPMAEANLKQALVPVGADVLPNPNGTAPGIYLPPKLCAGHNCAIFLLPGPPRELYPMFHAEVVPRLRALAGEVALPQMQVLKFTGIGESDFHQGVDAKLAEISHLEVGYCARIGELDLRLIGSRVAIHAGAEIALNAFEPQCFSHDGSELEAVVIRMLAERKFTIATAESCTGGLIAHRLTNVPGASEVFSHGFVTYSNEAKSALLSVPENTLIDHGAVSAEVVRAMAAGALRVANADIAIAVSGIAGPTGGSEEKPVGTAWIGVALKNGDHHEIKIFQPRGRHDFKQAVSQAALDEVRRSIVSIS
jgi:nicotinamide-nucleotide amidase